MTHNQVFLGSPVRVSFISPIWQMERLRLEEDEETCPKLCSSEGHCCALFTPVGVLENSSVLELLQAFSSGGFCSFLPFSFPRTWRWSSSVPDHLRNSCSLSRTRMGTGGKEEGKEREKERREVGERERERERRWETETDFANVTSLEGKGALRPVWLPLLH